MDAEPEVEEKPKAYKFGRAGGLVAFEGVNFSYQGRVDTLKDISFEAQPGQHIAIVGPTGAGKSTLMSLLPRFYDPQQGRILIEGIDIRELTLDSLRRQVGTVMQDPLLFSGTIADNIRYGRLDASMEDIIEAAKSANAHDFIVSLPDKYETKLGERGNQLSGGERQRISIARAFLKNAPILILDEPTAAIDSKTESVILESLERLMVGRTTFTIAHRLSTIRKSDFILVLNHGRLTEQGTHEELLRRRGLYWQLHTAQSGQAPQLEKPEQPAQPAQDASVNGQQVVYKTEVSKAKLDPALLWGHHIDQPKPDAQVEGHELRVAGWALGRGCPVIAVELTQQEDILCRVQMNQRRPDLAVAYPQASGAERGGFSTTVSLLGANELELGVQAVLEDQRRVPIGTVRARRPRREGDVGSDVALGSAVDHGNGNTTAKLPTKEARAQSHNGFYIPPSRVGEVKESPNTSPQERASLAGALSQPLKGRPASAENNAASKRDSDTGGFQ